MLLIQDDTSLANELASLLSENGFAVSIAGTGSQALSMTRLNSYEICLLDVGFPGYSGFSLVPLGVEGIPRFSVYWRL